MFKTQITIERTLRSRSATIIWKLISTAEGLSKWIAEDVVEEENVLIFTWGKPGQHYETRKADILQIVKNKYIRFKWQDEEEKDAYTEIRMIKLDVTDDYALNITDFAEPDDIDDMVHMWNHDLDRLQHKTGV